MKKTVNLFLTLIVLSQFVYATGSEAEVSVYTYASQASAGRSADRNNITSISLKSFDSADSVSAERDGFSTAVLISARVKNALEKLLEGRDYHIVEDSVFTREHDYGADAYGFIWNEYGFEIIFAFDSLSDQILAEIEKVYGQDAWLYGELVRSYKDNYSIRIIKADNVIAPSAGRLDFLDAMIAATVIGDTFQPLLGIHDGLGVLDEIGLAVTRSEVTEGNNYAEYRKLENNEEKIISFMHSINNMSGDFIDNLYSSVKEITRKAPDDGKIKLPEDFFITREGDNTDFAVFFYDILKRNDYQVKFVVIDSGDSGLYPTVFFREKGADLWGRIDGVTLEREKAENWRRLPALVISASVDYFEPDITDVLENGRILLPPPSAWHTSLY